MYKAFAFFSVGIMQVQYLCVFNICKEYNSQTHVKLNCNEAENLEKDLWLIAVLGIMKIKHSVIWSTKIDFGYKTLMSMWRLHIPSVTVVLRFPPTLQRCLKVNWSRKITQCVGCESGITLNLCMGDRWLMWTQCTKGHVSTLYL